MEDLDDLLSDLENVSFYSNGANLRAKHIHNYSSPSSSTSSSASFTSGTSSNYTGNKMDSNISDFIQSINKIVNSHDSIKTNRNESTNLLKELDEKKRESLHSTDSTYDDLGELDKLLDDLDSARKKLAMGSSISSKEVKRSNSQTDEVSNHYSAEELSATSSLIPSPSFSSPNSTVNKSQHQSNTSNSSYSFSSNSVNEPLVNMDSLSRFPVSDSDNTIEQSQSLSKRQENSVYSNKISSLNAAQELEKLMASLTMYKNQNDGHSLENDEIKVETKQQIVNKKDEFKSKNVCRSCGTSINGQVITALGYIWHPDCFVCYHCNCCIGTSIFYEKDNDPYCEVDYIQLFSPKCAACENPILDKMLTALNKSWHVNCFTCNSCSKLLSDESFLEINNTAYCKDCYTNELAPKCFRCNEAIIENFISALNSYFHPACFVCMECNMPFNASSFYEYNNMPYCELHYHTKRGSLCANCQQPINGRCVTAMNKKYHPEHFVCSFCLQYLNKGTFKEQNDKPYCHQCFQHLF